MNSIKNMWRYQNRINRFVWFARLGSCCQLVEFHFTFYLLLFPSPYSFAILSSFHSIFQLLHAASSILLLSKFARNSICNKRAFQKKAIVTCMHISTCIWVGLRRNFMHIKIQFIILKHSSNRPKCPVQFLISKISFPQFFRIKSRLFLKR